MDKGGEIYNGRRTEQDANFLIKVHTRDYIDEKIQPLATSRNHEKEKAEPLTVTEDE